MALLTIVEVKCDPATRETETGNSSAKGQEGCLFSEFFKEFGGLYWPSKLASALRTNAHVNLSRQPQNQIERLSDSDPIDQLNNKTINPKRKHDGYEQR